MAKINIRKLSESAKQRLVAQAQRRGASLEGHATAILEAASLAGIERGSLWDVSRLYFGDGHGADLDALLPDRKLGMQPPPDFSDR